MATSSLYKDFSPRSKEEAKRLNDALNNGPFFLERFVPKSYYTKEAARKMSKRLFANH